MAILTIRLVPSRSAPSSMKRSASSSEEIPPEALEHIFDRFVKLDSFKEGIGLGLPLSRKLAEQLGGKVELDTTYKDGARFIVTLSIS